MHMEKKRIKSGSRWASTLTDILTAKLVVIYDEGSPDKIRKEGKGKTIKMEAIQELVVTGKYDYLQAEQIIEMRLLALVQLQRVRIIC